MEHLAVIVVSAIIFVILCKVVYNGVLADPKDKLGDATIFKTAVIALVAAGLAKYVMDKYTAVKLPWQETSIAMASTVTTAATPAPAMQPPGLMGHRLSSLVPQ